MSPELKRYDGLILEAPDVSASRQVQALLMTEGQVTDRDEEYTAEQLEGIAAATNSYLATGEDTPLFYSSHEYTTEAIAGGLQPGLYVETITEDNLPNPGMTDLIGKAGLFGSISITMENGLKAYSGGIKKISVGLAPDNVIYEVSMVPWGAIRGASLYSKTFTPTSTSAGNLLLKGLSDGEKEAIATYGLTIAQSRQEMAIASESNAVYEDFLATILDINSQNADPRLIERAIDDLAAALRSRLNPDPLVPPLPPSIFSKEKLMPDELETTDRQPDLSTYQKQVADLKANNADMAAKLERMEKRQSVSAHYSRLRNQGEALVRLYKLTPAQYKATFSDDPEADIDKFLTPPEGEEGQYSLSHLEYHFRNLEQYGQAIASAVGAGQPEEIADPNQDQYEAEFRAYRRKRGYATKEDN